MKTLSYPGRVDIEGKVFVHDGEVFEAKSSLYIRATDTTLVVFERVWSADERTVLPDVFGELRIQ